MSKIRKGSRKDLAIKASAFFALLYTLRDYSIASAMHPVTGLQTIVLYVKVQDHENSFSANDLFDLVQPLGNWIVRLPKDVWDEHGKVMGIVKIASESKLFIED